jgi:hypothetical protein
MRRVARACGSILLVTFGAHASSCLLDRQLGGETEYLTPLAPPVIVMQRAQGSMVLTDPLPSEIIVAPTPTGGQPFSKTFRVTVRYDFPVPLFPRVFRDRSLDQCSTGEASRTCGIQAQLPAAQQVLEPPEAGIDRQLTFTMDFATPNKCTRVDLYVSPRFQDLDDTVRHLPARPGEVAHGRWFVVVPSSTGQLPPLDACNDERPRS